MAAGEEPTIDPDLKIKFKGASKRQRRQIGEILIQNYTELVNKMVDDADYATTLAYWKNYKPMTGEFISAGEFIKKYGKK